MQLLKKKKMSEERDMTDGITVSGDGSWQKRGFSSLFGVTTLIGWLTGKIIDIVVKSKYCKTCEFWKKKEETAEYEEWIKSHKKCVQCESRRICWKNGGGFYHINVFSL